MLVQEKEKSFATAVHGHCTELFRLQWHVSESAALELIYNASKKSAYMLLCSSHGSEPARSVWSRLTTMLLCFTQCGESESNESSRCVVSMAARPIANNVSVVQRG